MENKNCKNCNMSENFIEVTLDNGKEYHFDTSNGVWEIQVSDIHFILIQDEEIVAIFNSDYVVSFVCF